MSKETDLKKKKDATVLSQTEIVAVIVLQIIV